MHVYIHHFDKIVSIGAVSHMTSEGHSLVYVAACDHQYHVCAGLRVCGGGGGGGVGGC